MVVHVSNILSIMHEYVAGMLLRVEVRDAKVQQKKALYVIYVFHFAFALALTRWPATITADPRSWRISCCSRKYLDRQCLKSPKLQIELGQYLDQTWWSGWQETVSNFQRSSKMLCRY